MSIDESLFNYTKYRRSYSFLFNLIIILLLVELTADKMYPHTTIVGFISYVETMKLSYIINLSIILLVMSLMLTTLFMYVCYAIVDALTFIVTTIVEGFSALNNKKNVDSATNSKKLNSDSIGMIGFGVMLVALSTIFSNSITFTISNFIKPF